MNEIHIFSICLLSTNANLVSNEITLNRPYSPIYNWLECLQLWKFLSHIRLSTKSIYCRIEGEIIHSIQMKMNETKLLFCIIQHVVSLVYICVPSRRRETYVEMKCIFNQRYLCSFKFVEYFTLTFKGQRQSKFNLQRFYWLT